MRSRLISPAFNIYILAELRRNDFLCITSINFLIFVKAIIFLQSILCNENIQKIKYVFYYFAWFKLKAFFLHMLHFLLYIFWKFCYGDIMFYCKLFKAEDMAKCVEFILGSPVHMQVHDIIVRPTAQPF